MKRPRLSVVLPCYNEAANLPLLLRRYKAVAPKGLAFELVLVDNGSTDDSAAVLKKELAKPAYAFARSVRVIKNRGYGFGIFSGLKAAQGEVLAFSHADMQCDPASVFQAYDAYRQAGGGSILVKGKRQGRERSQQWVTNAMSVLASVVLGRKMTDINAQPKLFPAELMERLGRAPYGFEFDVYVMQRALSAGYRLITVPVVFGARAHGQSKWAATFFSRWRTMLRVALYLFKLRFSFERHDG
ncbi:MAG: glycosyltransferase family 2 protein [candidate division FCPU426 bacterium]